jgi:Ca2+-binding EF-hand superfamily protein
MDLALLDGDRLREGYAQIKKERRLVMVNGIGNYNPYMRYMPMARGRPDPAEMFNKVDTDGDGGISQSELDTFVQDISSRTGNNIDTTDAVATYDADKSGELSQDELKSFMEATMAPSGHMMRMGHGHHGHRGGLFKAIDTDGSGGISQSELDAFAQDISGKTGNTINTADALSTYDTNADGELTQDGLKSFMEASGMMPPAPTEDAGTTNAIGSTDASSTTSADSVISAYDINGDGVLSSDELQAYLDDTGGASFNTLVQEALSAYATNFGNSRFSNLENAFLNPGGSVNYSPVDLSA